MWLSDKAVLWKYTLSYTNASIETPSGGWNFHNGPVSIVQPFFITFLWWILFRNPDGDPIGFWCYTREREKVEKNKVKPRYCKIKECELEGRSFLFQGNGTSASDGDASAALNIIYGPVLPGVCGGVVALMTIVGFGEFLRRRRIFQKLRRR